MVEKPTYKKLEQRIRKLEQAESEHKRTEGVLHDRLKELNCLYGLSRLFEIPGISLEKILKESVRLVSSGWRFPDITCARIVFENQTYTTGNYAPTAWKLACNIDVFGRVRGVFEIFYLEKKPIADLGPFLEEEKKLLSAVSSRLGKAAERILTKATLKETRDYLENLINHANAPILVWDTEFRITRFNHAFERLTGYFSAEVAERNLSLLFPSRTRAESLQEIEKSLRDENGKSIEVPILTKGGDVRLLLWNSANIYKNDGRTLIATIAQGQDITERKEIDRFMFESESQYKALISKVADGILLVQDKKITFANDVVPKMLGLKGIEKLINSDALNYVAEDFQQDFDELLDSVVRTNGDEIVFSGQLVRSDGSCFWVDAYLNLIQWKRKPAILAAIRDVTRSKMEEIAIREESKYLRKENIRLRSSLKERFKFRNIVGKSPQMQNVYEMIMKTAASDASVIIYGESGTGKDLIAKAIHEMSDRSGRDFVTVNCGAIPEMLLEREFFGHAKGAFTGADTDILGFLDLADNGTLFLDEIGEFALNMQVKLLRAIDGGGYLPVGSNVAKSSDFRMIAATNRDLAALVNKGVMREDFFYRINVVPIYVPPLRERQEDIPLLVEHFLKKYNHKNIPAISARIFERLCNYEWPGNVRELRNVLLRFVTLGRLDFITTPSRRKAQREISEAAGGFQESGRLCDMLAGFEKETIVRALEANRWQRAKTAAVLGINRKTLFKKIKQYRLTSPV